MNPAVEGLSVYGSYSYTADRFSVESFGTLDRENAAYSCTTGT